MTCPRCAGHGRIQQVSRGILGEFIRQSTCPECNGAGKKIEQPCEIEQMHLMDVRHVQQRKEMLHFNARAGFLERFARSSLGRG